MANGEVPQGGGQDLLQGVMTSLAEIAKGSEGSVPPEATQMFQQAAAMFQQAPCRIR